MKKTIITADKFSENEYDKYLSWWADKTQTEAHMLPESVNSLKENLLTANFVVCEEKIIAAAGIFPARTKDHKKIIYKGRKVVELGSNYIDPVWRNKGLGKELVVIRMNICKEKNWFPVSVTTNLIMQTIFKRIGAVPMDNQERYKKLRNQLCLCADNKIPCNTCPLQKMGGWTLNHQPSII